MVPVDCAQVLRLPTKDETVKLFQEVEFLPQAQIF